MKNILLIAIVFLAMMGCGSDSDESNQPQLHRFTVEGRSMEPQFHSGDRIEVEDMSPNDRIERGDVVVIEFGDAAVRKFLKRVIGLPGETVAINSEGAVLINGQMLREPYLLEPCRPTQCHEAMWQLGDDEYFVLGDNRNASQDSINFGPVHREQVLQRAFVEQPNY